MGNGTLIRIKMSALLVIAITSHLSCEVNADDAGVWLNNVLKALATTLLCPIIPDLTSAMAWR